MENLKINGRYTKIIDGIPRTFVKKVIHTLQVADVDDVDLYVSGPLYQWQISPEGKFVFENAIEQPEWHKILDHNTYGYKIHIVATMEEKIFTEYYLKFGNK